MSIENTRLSKWIAAAALSAAALLGVTSANARDLAVSVGIHVPGIAVGIASPAHYAPAPVYYEPPHRHYRPAPAYNGYRPHHRADRGYYHRPSPRHYDRHEYRNGHRDYRRDDRRERHGYRY
jgi:hypothetical protein